MKLDSGVQASDLMKKFFPKGEKTESPSAHEFKLELGKFMSKQAFEQVANDVGDQDTIALDFFEHTEIDEEIIQVSTVLEEQEKPEEQKWSEEQENTEKIVQPKLSKSPEKYISFYPLHSAVGQSFSNATHFPVEKSGGLNDIHSALKTSVAGGGVANSTQIITPKQYATPDSNLKVPSVEIKNTGPSSLEVKIANAQPNDIGLDLTSKKTDVQFLKPIKKLPVMLLKQEVVGNAAIRNTYVENTNANIIRELPVNRKSILVVENIAVSNLTQLIRQQVDDVVKSTLTTNIVDVFEGEDMRLAKKISVQLFPRNLGVVEVNITNIGGKIMIVIETNCVKAENLMRAEMPLIMEKSIAAGITIEESLIRTNQDLERMPTNSDLDKFKQTDIDSSSSQENSHNKYLDVGIEDEFEISSNELNDDPPVKTGIYL